MSFVVHTTPEAENDLDSIAMYIVDHDGWGAALHVVREIRKKIDKLKFFPERGGHPIELIQMDRWNYREILCGPYRIFYEIEDKTVFVAAVADGRRDMIAFLTERLG